MAACCALLRLANGATERNLMKVLLFTILARRVYPVRPAAPLVVEAMPKPIHEDGEAENKPETLITPRFGPG